MAGTVMIIIIVCVFVTKMCHGLLNHHSCCNPFLMVHINDIYNHLACLVLSTALIACLHY